MPVFFKSPIQPSVEIGAVFGLYLNETTSFFRERDFGSDISVPIGRCWWYRSLTGARYTARSSGGQMAQFGKRKPPLSTTLKYCSEPLRVDRRLFRLSHAAMAKLDSA